MNVKGPVGYVKVACAIVHTVVSHSPAETNNVIPDNTDGLQLCVCVVCVRVKEKTVRQQQTMKV